jgi:hypothetical protein
MRREDLKYFTIEHLRNTDQISVRTANCCLASGLHSLYEVISFFEEHKSFLYARIKKAGKKTSLELEHLCKAYIPQLEDEIENSARNDAVLKVIRNLSKPEREIMLSLANLIIESGKILEQGEILYGKYSPDMFIYDFYERHCHFPMFWILEQYMKNDNSKEMEILIDSFHVFKHKKKLSKQEMGQKYNLSLERIRQIRKKIFHYVLRVPIVLIINKSSILRNESDWGYIYEMFQAFDFLCKDSWIERSMLTPQFG